MIRRLSFAGGLELRLFDGAAIAVIAGRWRYSDFKPVSLEMLIDQPVIAGKHFKQLDLTPGSKLQHVIDVAADSDAALAIGADRLKAYQRLPAEFAALFGARPYERYHFLLALSDRLSQAGLEHHQCSDNRGAERSLIDDDIFANFAALLPHEYFHSWNGKYRRPANLLSPDYQKPMHDDLLWVYEGLTEYYGDVMAARAGLWTPEQYRENLAAIAASLAAKQGRTWRPLQDTADMASKLYGSSQELANAAPQRRLLRRGRAHLARRRHADPAEDRRQEIARRLLPRVLRRRSGGPKLEGEKPSVKPYTENDVYKALNESLSSRLEGVFYAAPHVARPAAAARRHHARRLEAGLQQPAQ